jgi:hypothetical protein
MVESRVRNPAQGGSLPAQRRHTASAARAANRGKSMGKHFKRRRDEGASLIEFALLMPLLLLLVLGIIESGKAHRDIEMKHQVPVPADHL